MSDEPRDPARDRSHRERQHAFYAEREHAHLRAREADVYADKLVRGLAQALGITREARVLEVGAGFGRFSFALLDHCAELTALDLSERALCELEDERDRRRIPAERCRTRVADADHIDPHEVGAPFDFVLGFFFLHHMPIPARTIHSLVPLLGAGGRMGFLEPNRRNPLFALQVLGCRDMTWQEEKGMFQLSARGIETAYREAGLSAPQSERIGFYPPQLLNRFEWARSSEAWLERRSWLRPLLPFLLLTATRPASKASAG